ncbi:MAG TPA: glycogen synthase [Patescibacteria group bacterium]|nr:glycogen synthase [Patescibacteria group bacterium]
MGKNKYKEKLKVLHVTSELTPIAKAGGLGDVVGYLPKELAQAFHIEIRIIMPKYKFIDFEKYPAETIMKDIKLKGPKGRWTKISVWKTFLPETIVPVYLIDNPKIFNGESVYDHKVNGQNPKYPFFFLSKMALELTKAFDWRADVIHIHDGMVGIVPKWLKITYKNDPFFRKTASVLTIHNLVHQPTASISEAREFGLSRKDFVKVKKFLKKDNINIIAEAIDNSDMINTVSPTYAKEILTRKYGAGLHRLLKMNKSKFTGILNGIDYSNFDPRTNPDTPVKYWIDSLDKKVENKLYLQKKFGLTQSADLPLICVVSRLTSQKGLDLIEDVMKDLVDMGAQFVILGSGSKKIEKIFIKAEKKFPEAVAAKMEFDANLAQTIYAGADVLLMPSRFEPCGLSQIIAMRFGTIPIVRKTGGLADTVRDGYTGFVFNHYDKDAFLWAIRRTVDVYYNQKEHWRKMQINCMEKDFSWKNSAKKYIWLYKKAIRNHREFLKSHDENDDQKS